MSALVEGDTTSAAWVQAMELLLARPDGQAVNLPVRINHATQEHDEVRKTLNRFVSERRAQGPARAIGLVESVANTIFPHALYVQRLGANAERHLYEMERLRRPISRRRNPSGTYFERLVAFPTRDGEFNQLEQVIERLRTARRRNHRRLNDIEVGVALPTDALTVPIQLPGKDRRTRGFPCLSHLSFTLQDGAVHLAALYRSHHFVTRAYGNYVGLGRLLSFVCDQSSWAEGELLCVSAAASAEIGSGTGFGRRALTTLVADCRRALEGK